MNKICIYKITCLNNGKYYIGKTINYFNRVVNHRWNLKNNTHKVYLLQKYYNEFGENSFKYEVIKECKAIELSAWEKYYIKVLKPHFNTQIFERNGVNKRSKRRKYKMSYL